MQIDSPSEEAKKRYHRDSGMIRSSSAASSSDGETAPGAFAIGDTAVPLTEEARPGGNTIVTWDPEQSPATELPHQMVVHEAELAPDLDEIVAMGVQKFLQSQTIQTGIADERSSREPSSGRMFKAVLAFFCLAAIAAATLAGILLRKEENQRVVQDADISSFVNEQTTSLTGNSTVEITNQTNDPVENNFVVPNMDDSSLENEKTQAPTGNSTVESTNSTTEGWTTLGQDLYGKTWHDQYGSAVAVSHDGQRIVACARWPEFFTRVYEFDAENSSWQQLGDELPYGASEGVAIDETGQRVVIGDYTSGGARVFDWINSNWVESAHVGVGLTGEPQFLGISLSMSIDGNRVAVGDGPSQQAYVFEETESGAWVQIGDSLSGCRYPVRLSGDGRKAIVGGENAATVYEWNDVQWVQVGQTLSDEGAGGDYGSPIAISQNGNVVAVAASRANGGASANGIVRVYHWVDNNWLQLGGDIVGESPYDEFGSAIVLSGNGTRIATGAEFAEPGYVRVYEWNSLEWMKIGIEIEDSQYSYFGTAVDLSGDGEVVVAGDWSYNCEGGHCGFVRAFLFKHHE